MPAARYAGVTDPKNAVAELRPSRAQLIDLQGRVRPFGPDFLILHTVQKACNLYTAVPGLIGAGA